MSVQISYFARAMCLFSSIRWITRKASAQKLARGIALASTLTLAFTAHAAPGELDTSFVANLNGEYGRLIQSVGSGARNVGVVIAQPNGGLLVGGTCNSTVNSAGGSDGIAKARFCVARYRPPLLVFTGSWIDTSFGNQGTTGLSIYTAYSNRPESLADMALLPDGKILTAGTCSLAGATFFCVTRLQANGTLDTSFGFQGYASATFSVDATLKKILVQPDGRILLLGNCVQPSTNPATTQFCATRLLSNGDTDSSFGSAGVVLMTTPEDRSLAGAVLRADGSIVMAGVCSDFGRNLCVRALTADGQVDSSFGPTGSPGGNAPNVTRTLHISMGTSIAGDVSIAKTASGKLVLSINCIDTPTAGNKFLFCLARVSGNGSLDSSFGAISSNGRAYHVIGTPASTGSGPQALAIQPDGKIVASGYCADPNAASTDFCAARFHSDGALDLSFNSAGFKTTLTGRPFAFATALALQPDGKAVLAGVCNDSGVQKYCTVRLQGGPYGYRACTMDIDGDGRVLGTTDALIHARVSAGKSGADVTNGLSFAPNAQRTTWPAIRDYLGNHCGMPVLP
jgi:uncharacterized delta-60 repeat protein